MRLLVENSAPAVFKKSDYELSELLYGVLS